jgi:hypothetical protein
MLKQRPLSVPWKRVQSAKGTASARTVAAATSAAADIAVAVAAAAAAVTVAVAVAVTAAAAAAAALTEDDRTWLPANGSAVQGCSTATGPSAELADMILDLAGRRERFELGGQTCAMASLRLDAYSLSKRG